MNPGNPSDNNKYPPVTFTRKVASNGDTYYDVPLDASTDTSIPGYTSNIFIIYHGQEGAWRYNLIGSSGQFVIVVNTNEGYTRYIACNGKWIALNGGTAALFVNIRYNYQIPNPGSNVLGAGWLCVGMYDNNW